MRQVSAPRPPASRCIGWPFLVGILVSLAALYLAFRNVPTAALGTYLKSVDYRYLALSLVVVVFILAAKALRWQMILAPSASVGFAQVFHPMMIGFMLNCVLPGRIGELARPAILSHRHRIAFATGLSTVVAERILDMITLLAMLAWTIDALNLAAKPAIDFAGYRIDGPLIVSVGKTTLYLALALMAAIGLLRLAAVRRRIKALIFKLPAIIIAGNSPNRRQWATRRLSQPLATLVDQIADGLVLLEHPLRLAACIVLSAFIWLLAAVSFYILACGFPGVDLSLTQMIAVLAIICVCIALPSVPGWWGLWEAGGIFALTLLGVDAGPAAGFTLVNHAAQLFPIIAIGLGSALATGVSLTRITKSAGRV